MISPPGKFGRKLQSEGFRWIPFRFERKGLNPFSELSFIIRLFFLYRVECPDLVHHFTIKCVLYGSLVSRFLRIPRRVNAITGLGHLFTEDKVFHRLLRLILRYWLKIVLKGSSSRVIFQNPEDRSIFLEYNIIEQGQDALIRGSGVNTRVFSPRSEQRPEGDLKVLMATRILWNKGVGEFIDAARILKREDPHIEFILAGFFDPGNPSSVPREKIDFWEREGIVVYAGYVENMAELLQQADLVVHPTKYREGVPRILIEAAACGVPIITTDVPGCREVVEHGENGLLIPPKDVDSLVSSIRLLGSDHGKRVLMGKAGRVKALKEFDERIIIKQTLDVYREIISLPE